MLRVDIGLSETESSGWDIDIEAAGERVRARL
jgi:hypothetical protein